MPNQVRGMTPEAIRALFKRSFDAQADKLTLKLSNYNDEVTAMKNAMDASLEALNKDVGSSIENAASEAKRANDAIVALDAFDKAVSKQISGVLEESQAAIAEANALLAQMPEFEKKAQDAIDQAEDVSKKLADYKESQQKIFDELNKKAEELNLDLSFQSSQMGVLMEDWTRSFLELKNSVNASVRNITQNLSNAIEEQLKISPSLKALTDKLDSTNDSLSKLNNDYKSVNKKVSDMTDQVEPLSKQAKQAADDAQKAVEALRNPAYIGSSVLTVDQITGEPHWAKGSTLSDQKTPDGDKIWTRGANEGYAQIDSPYTLVDSRIPYKVGFWAKADGPGSLLSMVFYDEDGYGAIDTAEGDIPHNGSFFPFRLPLTPQWKKFEATVHFRSSVEKVRLDRVCWSDTNNNATRQYIGGFKFFPLIPDQAEIDTLQNNAILKNTKIGKSNTNAIDAINEGMKAQATLNQKQQEWNAVQKIVNDNQQKWNKTQEIVNQNQSKWNQAVLDYKELNDRLWGKQGEINKLNQAIDANQTELLAVNTRAIREITNGQNLIPYYKPSNEEVANGWSEWTRPAWGALDLKRNTDDSVYKGFVYYTFASTKGPAQYITFDIDPSLEYDYEVWLRGTEGGVAFIECRDENGNNAVESGGINGDNPPDYVSSSGTYLVSSKITHPKWVKYKTRIRFKAGVRRVYIANIYGNHSNGVQPATLDIGEDMRLYPHIPSQDDVNKALMAADKALKDQIDANGKIDRAQTKADEGFYKAIKALSMPEEANSLFAFIEPSDAEIKAAYESGKSSSIVYDQPEWTLFGHSTPRRMPKTEKPEEVQNEWTVTAGSSNGSKLLPASDVTYMPVIKGITYKLSFMGYTNFDKSYIYIQFYNQDEGSCFSNIAGFVDGKPDSRYSYKGSTSYVGNDILLQSGWHKYEFRIEMAPSTTSIRMRGIYWNHSKGDKGFQRITGMRFVPDIPSQAEIDKAQNNAIINNTNAIAINNWSDKIQAMINDNQQKQIDFQKNFVNSSISALTVFVPRVLRLNVDEGWSQSTNDMSQFFSWSQDSSFWSGSKIDFKILGKHNGYMVVHYRVQDATPSFNPNYDPPIVTKYESYRIENGSQKYRSGGEYRYYSNVLLSYSNFDRVYDVFVTYYPDRRPDGSFPDFQNPPTLNTNFPPKPTLRELE